ncbi:16S rRNA (cytidine(1402)-2'-O)-methyltransferase [hydrothermal vent metagenome]|uniref:16S rRNA (Cytidine(1402)-2'-O)-methyltransferase n=1 Tax=hydrothermal vent metagenome TaxID=652676 RepID=A0A3B1CXV7_9ZZZZ
MLYVVSTPIGNLKDITYRAVEILKEVDLIAAEDTRHTRTLTKYYEIDTPLTSYFEHNENKKSQELLKLLQVGKNIALVSDAGTPGISDPGYRLINIAREHNISINVIPGACALIAALTVSGLSASSFSFEGFLPVKTVGRKKKLESFLGNKKTVIFYESPHRIVKMLRDIQEVFNDPVVVCARELTKKFEEVRYGQASVHVQHFTSTKPKGEFVVLVSC